MYTLHTQMGVAYLINPDDGRQNISETRDCDLPMMLPIARGRLVNMCSTRAVSLNM
jgi:hypothetical protein